MSDEIHKNLTSILSEERLPLPHGPLQFPELPIDIAELAGQPKMLITILIVHAFKRELLSNLWR